MSGRRAAARQSADAVRRVAGRAARLPPLALAGVAVLFVALALLVVSLTRAGGGEGPPPADGAARLVPADALVYVHLSTDSERDGTRRAQRMAQAFPGYATARRNLLGRLSAPECGVELADVKGKEAALALLDAGAGSAGSLVLVDTGREQAKAAVRTCGTVQVVGIGRFLAVGQPRSLALAQQLFERRGKALADDPGFRLATAGLPAGRVLDGWVTATGVRRLLEPQGGLIGVTGTLLDQPGLRGSAFALTAADSGARITVSSLLDGKRRGRPLAPFTPSLAREVPGDAVAYLGLPGLSTATARLLSASGAGGLAALGPLLKRARSQLNGQAGGRLDRDLLALLRREVAVAITPGVPAPTLSLIARTRDAKATSEALARLQLPLARVLGAAGRPAPRWRRVAGAFQLKPASGIEFDYAIAGDKLVVSTKLAGIEAARRLPRRLTDAPAYQAALGQTPKTPLTSLVFLDFSQLLRLGEQTGLNDSKTYLAAKGYLQRVRAIGAHSSSDGRQSTAELLLTIP